jgi:hypothetical protein
MRKLVIAVIVFSFLGFGPLKSFFHKENGTPILQTINESGLFDSGKKANVFLVTEEGADQKTNQTALLIRYNANEKKMMVGSVLLTADEKKEKLATIKSSIEKSYNVNIDHFFTFNHSGLAHMIDLVAPNGIQIEKKQDKKRVNGEEALSLIEQYSSNQYNQEELKALFSSFKNELVDKQTKEHLFTIAPAIIDEVFKNVKTDLNKGELLSLGFSAIMNPITAIEPIKLKENDQSVNSQINRGLAPSVYN